MHPATMPTIPPQYLFIDRDGVINRRIMNGYVTRWEDFSFLPGVLEALSLATEIFDNIFVVTNQQGIGKGLMTIDDLTIIHSNMCQAIEAGGGRIDEVFFCPSLASDNDPNRKPSIGMALQAKEAFPHINFQQSWMIGDTFSDLQFAHNAGMKAIWIDQGKDVPQSIPPFNYRCNSLFIAIQWLRESVISTDNIV